MELKTNRPAQILSRLLSVLAILLAAATPPALAQTNPTPEQIREEIRTRKLTPEQIREALREAGYDPDALNAYMPGTGRGAATGATTPGAATTPPSGALTTEPMAP
ncbi:MAG TPA: hypothetical protein VLT84_03790, partial [Acidobacteriota bacterium]|nr:hypothetical protein [Acidobacteriota bacterium]